MDGPSRPGQTATDEEVREAYETEIERYRFPTTVWASQVARGFGEDATEAAKADERSIIEKAQAELEAGVPFEDVARRYSTDHLSAAQGGRMYDAERPPVFEGQADPALLPPVIQEVLFRLAEGEVSDIVESPFGFHIIRVDKRREAGVRSLDEVAEAIRAEILGAKRQALVQEEVLRLWAVAEEEGVLELPSLAVYMPEPPEAPPEPPDEG